VSNDPYCNLEKYGKMGKFMNQLYGTGSIVCTAMLES
jgi:hypothetical protein